MRYCADHSVHGALVRALVAAGVDIFDARQLGPGIPDDEILSFAHGEDRILIAQDTDFGGLIFLRNHASVGVVLIRLRIRDSEGAARIAARILALPRGGRGAFTTLDIADERIRPLPKG